MCGFTDTTSCLTSFVKSRKFTLDQTSICQNNLTDGSLCLKIQCRTLWLQKHGNEPEDYEDAFAPTGDFSVEVERFRCAVADGATESSFAKQWAQLLTDGYLEETEINELKEQFAEEISDKELSWFAEEKASMGAFAAILGLELNSDGTWSAEATGDCCLFQTRAKQIISSFPLTQSEQFNNSPKLISSKADDETGIENTSDGNWQSGDRFVLASDALAKSILFDEENGREAKLLERLFNLHSPDDMQTFFQGLRSQKDSSTMRNDDVTFMDVSAED
jgi:hypothetical protein